VGGGSTAEVNSQRETNRQSQPNISLRITNKLGNIIAVGGN